MKTPILPRRFPREPVVGEKAALRQSILAKRLRQRPKWSRLTSRAAGCAWAAAVPTATDKRFYVQKSPVSQAGLKIETNYLPSE